MCGFVGYVLNESVPRPDLSTWSDCIHHRGPDQAGQATDQQFGVGTRRLSILDLSTAGDQPMCSERSILAYNGEIYNHLAIRAELDADGPVVWRSHSDTETILRAVERWGVPETLARLNGIYAIAIWDRRERRLSLARDPLGAKPLLYLDTPDGLYFGSELKSLRPYSNGRVSPEGLALYLLLGFSPAPYSLLEGVRKLRPGELLVIGERGRASSRIRPDAWTNAETPAADYGSRVVQLREAVGAAARRQLLADVPVGIFLSGGVDSTVVASAAAAVNPSLVSFSIRPDENASDPGAQQDAELAATFARAHGLTHHELLLRPAQLIDEYGALLGSVDEPVHELYFAAEVLLSRRAREAGVPVVLTGHGGDELFLGYPTYQALIKGDRYNAVPGFGPLARAAAALPPIPPAARENLRGAASVWRLPFRERYAVVSAVGFDVDAAARITGLAPEQVEALVQAVIDEVSSAVEQLPQIRPLSTVERFARMDLLLKVPEHYNMRLDKASMAASVEARVPLQDLELIGFVAGLPGSDLLRGGLKGMLKQAFADTLPVAVAGRPKQTFQAPMLSWVRGRLAPWVAERLDRLPAAMRAGLGDGDATSTRLAYRAWSLALLEGWRAELALEY